MKLVDVTHIELKKKMFGRFIRYTKFTGGW